MQQVLDGGAAAPESASGGNRHDDRYTAPSAPSRRSLGRLVPFTAPKPISPAPDDLRGARVLVVDDERSWRVILETDLRMIGYKVSMAEDADQALEGAGEERPEVAIIDLMLPERMDGWGLLNAL